jgi:capsule polysaccharide export protein KpsE/RkpR
MAQDDGRDPVWRLLNALAVLVGLLVVGMIVVLVVTSI